MLGRRHSPSQASSALPMIPHCPSTSTSCNRNGGNGRTHLRSSSSLSALINAQRSVSASGAIAASALEESPDVFDHDYSASDKIDPISFINSISIGSKLTNDQTATLHKLASVGTSEF